MIYLKNIILREEVSEYKTIYDYYGYGNIYYDNCLLNCAFTIERRLHLYVRFYIIRLNT
jgi:hypothetical protein